MPWKLLKWGCSMLYCCVGKLGDISSSLLKPSCLGQDSPSSIGVRRFSVLCVVQQRCVLAALQNTSGASIFTITSGHLLLDCYQNEEESST